MLSPDEKTDGGAQSPNLMQAERVSGDEEFDSGSKSSKSSRGPSGEKSTSTTTDDDASRELGITRIPLEDTVKGLIISQIRAPFVQVEEGIINLVKDCLLAEQPFVTSASLSGHVDHFQSVDDEDLGWGCGWRNIQILCSFLLAEDPEAREVLFNGSGFVPDIPALQTWLEIAWANGFDLPGAEYFGWSIAGTRKWIGTTECAALLRSFGVRAKIVSFTALGGKRVRGGLDTKKSQPPPISLSSDDEPGKESLDSLIEGMRNFPGDNSRGGAINSGKICEHGTKDTGNVNEDSESCEYCVKALSQSGPSQKGGSLLSGSAGGSNGSGSSKQETGAAQESGSAGSSDETRGNPDDAGDHTGAEPGDMSQKHIKRPGDEESSVSQHNWHYVCDGCRKPIEGRAYKSLMARNLDLCSTCMMEVDENPTKERGSHNDYVLIEEHPAIRNSGPPEEDQQREEDSGDVDEEHAGIDEEETSEDTKDDSTWAEEGNEETEAKTRERGGNIVEEKSSGSEDQMTQSLQAATGPQKKKPKNGAGSKPIANGERRKAGMLRPSSEGDKNFASINHHHLIEWVWSYFTDGSAQRFTASSDNLPELVNMSKRSPLYFQHRGHSRTIVGIERRGRPTSTSEDVYLLVLDPSVSTELLAKSLREKSGWQQLIKYDVHSLKETEYQLCYVDPGIAAGEELEQLKVLSSLRYSYFSK